MKRIAIVGAGKIGQMIADMLGQCGDYQVAVIDKSAEQLQRLSASPPVECLAIDVAGSKLTDHFEPYAVHVYELNKR